MSDFLEKTLPLLNPKKAAGSLALTNMVDQEELQHFMSLRNYTSDMIKIYGTEFIPGCILKPSHIKVRMPNDLQKLLCEWYAILYGDDVSRFMSSKMNQHARMQIGSEIFASKLSGRHENNSNILAKWEAQNDETSDFYPGEVQYYFEHKLRLPEGNKTHLLAYVKWYKHASTSDIRFKHKFMEPEKSNTELWKNEFCKETLDSIIAVHRIYSRAIKISYRVGKNNNNNYASIISLNRKFNM